MILSIELAKTKEIKWYLEYKLFAKNLNMSLDNIIAELTDNIR